MADDERDTLDASPPLRVVRDAGRVPEERAGLHSAQIDGTAIDGREALFDALSEALSLPAWFGRNWDALSDSLADLSWLEGADVCVAVPGADAMLENAPKASAHLLEIWTSAAVAQAKRGRALQLFLIVAE